MAVVQELLRVESDGTLSFGDYTLASKTKLDGFEFQGDIYKVKTFNEITKLERNGMFAYESVTGTSVEQFAETEEGVAFKVYGPESTQFTVGLAEDSLYEVFVDGESIGKMTTNLSGKLSASVDLNEEDGVVIEIVKR
jgi:hypothetical protein